jgi:hypothetical protein
MSDMPKAYRELIAPLIDTTRKIIALGDTLAPFALVGNTATRQMQLVDMELDAADPKSHLAESIRAVAKAERADFIFTIMDAWALAPDQADRYEEIIERYGSIGESPYRIDIVSFSLETHWGLWMAQVPIETGEDGTRSFAEPHFRRYPEAEGRFVGLLPAQDGGETPPVLH